MEKYTIPALVTSAILAMTAPVIQGQTAMDLLDESRLAYEAYDFEEASRLLSLARKKSKKGDSAFMENYSTLIKQVDMARNFLDRVEKLEVIDSISVPRKDFFRYIRIPRSSGRLKGADALPPRLAEGVDYVFSNEGEDYKIWAAPDSVGVMRLVESNLLTDGTWSAPVNLPENLTENGDEAYPFMMSDGVRLYYSDNGENSLGGYDIMVATRDASDGSFLQPSNLGFPYNSPYNDYMLAFDELNGVGWLASDRNDPEGDNVTLYVFLTKDLRSNYDPDEEGITGFARISDYIVTQPEDADYDTLLATIRAIDPEADEKKPEFTFMASGGRVFHRYDELPNRSAQTAMRQYQTAKGKVDAREAELDNLRRKYHEKRTTALERDILRIERELESERSELTEYSNKIHKLL